MPDPAQIDNPVVVSFSNEYIRPQAEELVRMKILCAQFLSKWTSQIMPIAGGLMGTTVIDDGRAVSGVSVLTVADAIALKAVVQTIHDELDAAGVDDQINLPAVRKIEITT